MSKISCHEHPMTNQQYSEAACVKYTANTWVIGRVKTHKWVTLQPSWNAAHGHKVCEGLLHLVAVFTTEHVIEVERIPAGGTSNMATSITKLLITVISYCRHLKSAFLFFNGFTFSYNDMAMWLANRQKAHLCCWIKMLENNPCLGG